MKKVLMLTAKEMDVPFILQAQMLGYYVVTTGNAPEQVGHRYADEYLPFDYSDYEGITKLARENNIEGVLHGCSDNCALTAAYICDHLGLAGHDRFDITEIIHRKDKFKKFARQYNIKTPQADYYSQIENALMMKKNYQFPLIVKPSDMAGGQGVNVIYTESEYDSAVKYAFTVSKSKIIVIEPFINGTLHSLHVFLVKQRVRAYGTANDYSFMNRFMTSYGLFPADNYEKAISFLIPEIERIADLLHLVDGQMDIQYIMCDGQPWIIEMMRRNPGNHTTGVISNSIGLNWREWIVRAEVGENVQMMPTSNLPQKYYGYYCLMGEHNGIYGGVEIDDEFKPFIIQLEEWKTKGFMINDYLYDKMGIVLFAFSTKEEKDKYLPKIHRMIRINYLQG